jgi:hypothetical protein
LNISLPACSEAPIRMEPLIMGSAFNYSDKRLVAARPPSRNMARRSGMRMRERSLPYPGAPPIPADAI